MSNDSAETHCGPFGFRGWVPTISGRLSFSVFGDAQEPTKAVSANVNDDDIRFLAAYQFRDTSDALVPLRKHLGPHVLGVDGQFFFVFIAKTEDTTASKQFILTGRALIFRRDQNWESIICPAIQQYQKHLRNFDDFSSQSLLGHANNEHDNIITLCTKNRIFIPI